jgi:hypothetical protein
MSAITFVTIHDDGDRSVDLIYREEVRGAAVINNPCKLEVSRLTGVLFKLTLLTNVETKLERDRLDPLLTARRLIVQQMLIDVTCCEADIDIVWIRRRSNDTYNFTRHENVRLTIALLGLSP